MSFMRYASAISLKRRTFAVVSLLALIIALYVRYSTINAQRSRLRFWVSPPSRSLVVASLKRENTQWIQRHFPNLNAFVYVVDDPHAHLATPKNKGNEAMVYLTYIIDYYEALPDVSIFVHAHSGAKHNDEPMDGSMVQALQRLRDDHVIREGYFNLRCSWEPGCPVSLDLYKPAGNSSEQETRMKQAWQGLHPGVPLPAAVAQPCCGQFAASRDRIRSVPRKRWVHFRDWLLETELDDYHSGRIWEYNWQFVLAGRAVFCPAMDTCYCRGYGICFGSRAKFETWWEEWTAAEQSFRDYLRLKAAGDEDLEFRQRI